MPADVGSLRRWFPATEQAVSKARDWIVEVAAMTGHARLAPTVELLVSELATNAIRYAGGERFVVEFVSNHKVVVAVCDPSPDLPQPRDAPVTDAHGRGLELLDKLADQWGVAVGKRGKCVWFELADPPSQRVEP